MSSLKVLIVDDEPLARRRLLSLLKDHADLEIAGECGTGRDAIATIRRSRPDIVFLDIHMPGMDGFEVIETIGIEKMPVVIFVTAYEKHALQAFDVNAIDYLLKPFDEKRLLVALKRARKQVGLRSKDSVSLDHRIMGAIADATNRGRYRARFAVKSAGRVYFVPVEEIDWIDASGKYVHIHAGKEEHLHRAAIGQIETELDPEHFARIHRSTIVNIKQIKELQPLFHGEYAVILKDGTELTLSRGYRRKLRALLDLPD
jgi:two-component system LytT family response regulator